MSAIVLFDGVCNFCNSSVNFIIRHDRGAYFRFAALQSDEGRRLGNEHGFASTVSESSEYAEDLNSIDSIILVEDDRAHVHSTAALRIVRKLGPPWSWLYAFVIVPRPIRDFGYKLFAKFRYRLFGRKDECMLPTPDVRARFLA